MSYVFSDSDGLAWTDIDDELDSLTKLSVSLWVKKGSTANGFVQVGRVLSAGGDGWFVTPKISSGDAGVGFESGWRDDAQPTVNTSSNAYGDKTAWTHLLFVYDGTQGTAADRIAVYVNGAVETSGYSITGTLPTALGVAAGQDFAMGCWTAGYDIKVAEVGLWAGVALTSGNAATLYTRKPGDSGIAGLSYYMPLLSNTTESINAYEASGGDLPTQDNDHPSLSTTYDITANLIEPNGGGGIPG